MDLCPSEFGVPRPGGHLESVGLFPEVVLPVLSVPLVPWSSRWVFRFFKILLDLAACSTRNFLFLVGWFLRVPFPFRIRKLSQCDPNRLFSIVCAKQLIFVW